MIIDLHTHTKGISPCAKAPYSVIIDDSIAAGLDGFALANHYYKLRAEDFETPLDFAKAYIKEFESAEEYGKQKGFKVFFAAEITAEKLGGTHLLAYGIPYEFLLENPEVYDLELEELYPLVKKYGGALIQAHPYRGGKTVVDTRYIDGVEINCLSVFPPTFKEKLIPLAIENGLHITCGADYHASAPRIKCGMVIPDNITDSISLGRYILSDAQKTLLVYEADQPAEFIMVNESRNLQVST